MTPEQERQAFESAIDANPLDVSNHLVYADWLREHGHHDEGDFRQAMGDWHRMRYDAGNTEVPDTGRWIADVVHNPDPYSGRLPLPRGVRPINLPTAGQGRRGQWFHSYAAMQWPSYRDMEADFRESFNTGRRHSPEQMSRRVAVRRLMRGK